MPFFPQFSNLFAPPYIPPAPALEYAWFKADVGVTYDGSNIVSQWNDQSGNGRNLIVPSEATGPTRVASGINSLPTIEYNSPSDGLRISNDTTTIKSLVAVVRTSASLQQYQCICEAYGGGLYTVIGGGNPYYFGSYWATFVEYSTVSASTDYILGVRTEDGVTSYGYRNDEEAVEKTNGSGFQSRSHIYVGNDSSLTQDIDGYLSELILFDFCLTDTQMGQYMADLNTKYSIW